MRVKICGIRNLDDALFAINCGADALGFVFYEKSPRYIKPQDAYEISKKLPLFIQKVALFVNSSPDEINNICKIAKMSLAQIHFEVDREFLDRVNYDYTCVVRAKSKNDIQANSDNFRLIDAFVPSFGGEGKRINLDWFNEVDCSKIILAGGLNYDNLDEIKKYKFYGVDVSSGVESNKGVKSHQKIEAFIQKAKRVERA